MSNTIATSFCANIGIFSDSDLQMIICKAMDELSLRSKNISQNKDISDHECQRRNIRQERFGTIQSCTKCNNSLNTELLPKRKIDNIKRCDERRLQQLDNELDEYMNNSPK